MAKMAKSKDTANWRKGKDLQIGDQVAVAWDDNGDVTETSPIVEYLGKVSHMSVTNHAWRLANGRQHVCAGGEFTQGRY